MPLMFNTLLREAGLALHDVRLLRHKDGRSDKGCTPYELWRDARDQFELYQSTMGFAGRTALGAPYWASFVGTPRGETVFAGLYAVTYQGVLKRDRPAPHIRGRIEKAGSCDIYKLTMQKSFEEFDGKLLIDWGKGTRSWVQRADRQDKRVMELRKEFKEPDFPGFLHFKEPLSKLDKLPKEWIAALQSCKGIYLLTCPKTREQYVGAAHGAESFWGRWQCYVKTGHGGNVGLKSRNPSDYQVSILEVAGTAATTDDILAMEKLWKAKLQSREMGLNRN
jgi:hypothetical protein